MSTRTSSQRERHRRSESTRRISIPARNRAIQAAFRERQRDQDSMGWFTIARDEYRKFLPTIGEKWCPGCERGKPFAEFHNSVREKFGVTVYCKECNIRRDREYKDKNPDAWRAIRRRASRKYQFKRFYNITPERHERALIEQNGVCATCYEPETARGRGGELKPLAIDHDHITGEFRGLLCDDCNNALGRAKDDPNRLRALAAYVERKGQK